MHTTLFLCGDVMTGRGIDQVMAHPSDPQLYEPWVRDAVEYVRLAERANGAIPRAVGGAYVWGDALGELERVRPEARIVNLETSITRSDDAWPAKGINYRMSPANVDCLRAARIDACSLANNHVIDWGYRGLAETLEVLASAGISTSGAGKDLADAERPAIVPRRDGGRVLVFGCCDASSGVPTEWAATAHRPGVNLLPNLGDETADAIGQQIAAIERPLDLVVASVHWGGNWGYDVPEKHIRFARRLVRAGVDIVHGHSSHHPRPFEVFEGRLILYGCGDFVNDYEGITGYEAFRSELTLMYLPSLDTRTGELVELAMVPFELRNFRLRRAQAEAARWLSDRLSPLCRGVALRGPDEAGVLRASAGGRP